MINRKSFTRPSLNAIYLFLSLKVLSLLLSFFMNPLTALSLIVIK